MTNKKKKFFPKLKKKLQWFLTDESGKITKKDALWLAAGAMILNGVQDVSAAHCSGHVNSLWGDVHSNTCPAVHSSTVCWHASQWHANGTWKWGHISGNLRGPAINQWHANWFEVGSNVTGTRTAHSSGVVNGHYSGIPNGGHLNGYNRVGAQINQWHANWYEVGWHQSGYARVWTLNQAAISEPLHCNTSTNVHANHNSSWSGDDSGA